MNFPGVTTQFGIELQAVLVNPRRKRGKIINNSTLCERVYSYGTQNNLSKKYVITVPL